MCASGVTVLRNLWEKKHFKRISYYTGSGPLMTFDPKYKNTTYTQDNYNLCVNIPLLSYVCLSK